MISRPLAAPLLWQLLEGWHEHHHAAHAQGLTPNPLAAYIYDSYLMKYGMHSLADDRVVELVSTLFSSQFSATFQPVFSDVRFHLVNPKP